MTTARPGEPSRHLTALLAMAAGAAGLSYEILWSRALALEVGGALAAFTIVVTAFLSGLASGAWLFGRMADRTDRPLRVFALLQIMTAAAGTLSVAAVGASPIRDLLRRLPWTSDTFLFTAAQALVAGTGAFLPAVLMGGTLPLLLRATGGPSRAGACARIAGANAMGAAAGSLACGFILLPALGLLRSLVATALLSALLAITARGARSALPDRPAVDPGSGEEPPRFHARGARILGVLLLTGLALTALEVIWTRIAHLCFGASAQSGSLVLAAVIAGLAIGNLIGPRLVGPGGSSAGALALLASGAALATVASSPVLGRLPLFAIGLGRLESLSVVPWAGPAIQLLTVFIIAAVPSILVGAIFPVGFAALLDRRSRRMEGRIAGAASASVSLGSLLGPPAAYLLLLGPFGSRACLFSAAGLLGAASLLSPAARERRLPRLAGAASILITAAIAWVGSWSPEIMSSGPYLYGGLYGFSVGGDGPGAVERAILSRGEVVFSREGPHAFVTVRRQPDGILSMQVNGKTDASTGGDMKTQTLMAQIPLLASGFDPANTDVLVIGLGSGVTAASVLTHPIASLTVLEISPEVIAAATLFEEANRRALEDPRTRVVAADAHRHLLFDAPEYDAIISQPSNPWIAGEAVLFTREFFALARDRLAPGGIMCQWVQGYGLDPADFASVVATFASVFPEVTLWEESTAGGDYLMLGSTGPIAVDSAALERRLASRDISGDLARIEIRDPADLLVHFVAGDSAVRAMVQGAPVQTQDRLQLEHTAPVALRTETLGGILAILEPHRPLPRDLPGMLGIRERDLAARLAARAGEWRREREWAQGLGLTAGEQGDPSVFRAVSYLRAGMRNHALQEARELVRRKPLERLPRLLLAHLSMSMGMPEESVEQLEAALALAPDDYRLRLFLSRAYFASGRLQEALLHNVEAARLEPRSAEAASDRCAMLLSIEDLASAEAACRDAIAFDPDLAQAHANLGLVHLRRSRTAEAERQYRRALDLDRTLLDARYNLALLLQREGRPVEGLTVLDEALSLAGVDPGILRLAADLARETGDDEALERYETELGSIDRPR